MWGLTTDLLTLARHKYIHVRSNSYVCVVFTCDLQGNRVLLITDAHHDLTAVQARVAGAQPWQSQASIVAVSAVTRQRHAALEGLLHLRDGGDMREGRRAENLETAGCRRYLHHVVSGHQDWLLLLQTIWASLTPNLGPLDPGDLGGRARVEGEDAGQEDCFGQLLADGLMGHLPHVHQRFCSGRIWREETWRGSLVTKPRRGQRLVLPPWLLIIAPAERY